MSLSFLQLLLGFGWFISSINNISRKDTAQPVCNVAIDNQIGHGVISPSLMGFNVVYNYAVDSAWKSTGGIVPKLLKELDVHLLRYPGGTVATFYHWDYPTGQGHKDSWDPRFDSTKNSPSTSMMDIDEYLLLCKALHTEPLIGINMGSGVKYKRIEDGIREAVALVVHCKKMDGKVKYFYLDNEPYQRDANYTFSADEYAEMINRYSAAMKRVDHNIKIIVNTKPVWKPINQADLSYTTTLITKAGQNIDYIDVHDYWAWGHASFTTWQSQIPMQIGSTGMTYAEQRPFYQQLASSLGYPHIDMISLEWNIGPPGRQMPPSPAEAALMIGEQYMQLIQSGMAMAAFWPAYWPKVTNWSSRALLSPDYQPNKVFEMFHLFTPVLGQERVESTTTNKGIQALAAQSAHKDTLWLFLLNKVPRQPLTDIHIKMPGFNAKKYQVIAFNANDSTDDGLKTSTKELTQTGPNSFRWEGENYSFARLMFIR